MRSHGSHFLLKIRGCLDFGRDELVRTREGQVIGVHGRELAVIAHLAQAFDAPARQSLLPSVVREETFQNAITVSSTVQSLAFVSGPGLAGLVAQSLTWRLVFLGLVPFVVVGGALVLVALRPLGGLVDGTVYVVRVIDANTIELRPSEYGAPISVTWAAGATHTLLPAAATVQLVFTTSNWSTPQTVYLAALDDVAAEGRQVVNISHSVQSRDIATGVVRSAPTSTTLVIGSSALVGAAVRALTIAELIGARIEIDRGGRVVRTRVRSAVAGVEAGTLLLTVVDTWPAAAEPEADDIYRITLDDAIRGFASSISGSTLTDSSASFGSLRGATVVATGADGTVQQIGRAHV